MDIEEQRKAFDKWVLTHPDNLDLTAYEENIMFDAWLAAQNQETVVVVAFEPSSEKIKQLQKIWFDSGCAHIMKTRTANDLYKAVIQEAQK